MKRPVEEGNPADATDGFRRTLGEFATGVTVITTFVDGVPYGLTSNSFASVSMSPPGCRWTRWGRLRTHSVGNHSPQRLG